MFVVWSVKVSLVVFFGIEIFCKLNLCGSLIWVMLNVGENLFWCLMVILRLSLFFWEVWYILLNGELWCCGFLKGSVFVMSIGEVLILRIDRVRDLVKWKIGWFWLWLFVFYIIVLIGMGWFCLVLFLVFVVMMLMVVLLVFVLFVVMRIRILLLMFVVKKSGLYVILGGRFLILILIGLLNLCFWLMVILMCCDWFWCNMSEVIRIWLLLVGCV